MEQEIDTDGMIKGKIPAAWFRPASLSFCISELLRDDKSSKTEKHQTFRGEWLFNFKIPPFQRPVVWTEAQCISFIESAWKGFSLGTYVVNKVPWNSGMIHEADDYLLDGLQRLTAIMRYTNDEFKVFGYFYSELDRIDYCRFENVSFPQLRVNLTSDTQLRELYNALNYGGTPHTEDQRA